MSFKITITNNKTGEVLVSHSNVDAILGGIALSGGARGIALADCNSIVLAQGIASAEKAISMIKNDNPELVVLAAAIHAMSHPEAIDRSTEVKNDAD